jgi:hypothetical protein
MRARAGSYGAAFPHAHPANEQQTVPPHLEIREKSPRYWKTGRRLSAKRIAENKHAEEVRKWIKAELAKVKAEIKAKVRAK